MGQADTLGSRLGAQRDKHHHLALHLLLQGLTAFLLGKGFHWGDISHPNIWSCSFRNLNIPRRAPCAHHCLRDSLCLCHKSSCCECRNCVPGIQTHQLCRLLSCWQDFDLRSLFHPLHADNLRKEYEYQDEEEDVYLIEERIWLSRKERIWLSGRGKNMIIKKRREYDYQDERRKYLSRWGGILIIRKRKEFKYQDE